MICNGKFICFGHLISHFHNCISRISLLSICIFDHKCNFVCSMFFHIPQTSGCSLWSTVQIILVIISLKLICHIIDYNLSICNTIAVSSDDCSKTCCLLLICLCIFIAKNHIGVFSILIFYHKRYDRRSEICNLCTHPLCVRNSIKRCPFSIGKLSKRFLFHNCNCLLKFYCSVSHL